MTGNTFNAETLYGATVTGTDGDKIGKVDEVYLDNATNQPEWVSVKTGLFGSNVSLIPLSSATVSGDTITVPFEKSMVKDAPHHDPGHELSEADEDDLYRYYGISSSGGTVTETSSTQTGGTTGYAGTASGTTSGTTDTAGTAGTGVRGAGHDTSGPNTDDAMTRSKEELHVAKESREAGRARLRK
ncbi:PRC-barrel domain-containing protein, partial [Kineococcus auxinigenes]|uniref:PRC-barrel domain-containing protein n=1 Tax=Kineococcus sp. SYSU DK032 TaxID=3383153 RepID=UPI003D7EE630